jgi:hypothetical protein
MGKDGETIVKESKYFISLLETQANCTVGPSHGSAKADLAILIRQTLHDIVVEARFQSLDNIEPYPTIPTRL